MDQLFEEFKLVCGKSALSVELKKMQMRMQARVNAGAKTINDDNAPDDNEDEEHDNINDGKKQRQWSICNVSFSNFDLTNLVNG
jgi:hypothetical protein